MIQFAATIFFLATLLLALAGLHVAFRTHWNEMILALRGELGRGVMTPRPLPRATARAAAAGPWHTSTY